MTPHIPLLGATGRTGRLMLEEALPRGLRVVSDAPWAKPASTPSFMTAAGASPILSER